MGRTLIKVRYSVDSMHVHVTSDCSLLGVRGVVAALRSASDPSTFSATRRDARPAARAQRRCSGAGRSHNGRLERCATLVSTCTAARSATTTCARPPTQFKARAPSGRCRCAVAALSERARWRRHGQRQDPAPPGQHHGRPCLVLEARRRVPSSTEGTPSVSRRASPVRPPSPPHAPCTGASGGPGRGRWRGRRRVNGVPSVARGRE